MNTPMKKAVIYCRVSTKEQVEVGNSLFSQEKLCRDYATKQGYEVVHVYIEQGESAKTADRTELRKLLEYCSVKAHGISVVIAYKIDRIARNLDDYRHIRMLLKRYGVEVQYTSETYEDTPAGRFMENIIANVAQFDNDVRTERSMNGMKDAMRSGRYVWNAPFGYTNVKVAGKSTITPNEKASIIRLAFEEVAKNEDSVDAIRRRLYKQGLTTSKGTLFTRSFFYRVLTNEVYCGWINKFGERHKGTFEPIISEQLFEQVQRILGRRSNRYSIYKVNNPDFPLRRFVMHPKGFKLTGYWANGRSKKYPYYRFSGLRGTEMKKDALEQNYAQKIDEYAIPEKHIGYFRDALKRAFGHGREAHKKEQARLKRLVDELTEKENLLVAKSIKGIISDTILQKQLAIIEKELIEANAALLKLSDNNYNIDELIALTTDYLINPGIVWSNARYEIKQQLQWFEFPNGAIFEKEKFRTNNIAPFFRLKDYFLPYLSPKVTLRGQKIEPCTYNKHTKELALKCVQNLDQLAKIIRPNNPQQNDKENLN